ncbi:hypothetical protein RFI_36066 [Reticulomyxa filosa]|uniref:Uncharacterized protein n=1 Tax=Reticulomyxa filosa TaxID=46433 RepID=X6LHH2_RETFI|nr:hypothetical protein RFI_36066 [Reticulomyxa filosa]|eukprot:ETO01373.1 hypothetical protein RFI_36066 [Reticulomyxa filosa]
MFNKHTDGVNCVEYSPFVVDDIKVGGNSNVICSGSLDNAIRFWDIRSNKKELSIIDGDDKEDNGIFCIKFVSLKKTEKDNENTSGDCDIYLCYGSRNGHIRGPVNAYLLSAEKFVDIYFTRSISIPQLIYSKLLTTTYRLILLLAVEKSKRKM